jgi:hypothetical protein
MIQEGKEPQLVTLRGRVETCDPDSYCFTVKDDTKKHENIRHDAVQQLQDPNRLKWSPDGKYVAKLDIHQSGTDIISIFEQGASSQGCGPEIIYAE